MVSGFALWIEVVGAGAEWPSATCRRPIDIGASHFTAGDLIFATVVQALGTGDWLLINPIALMSTRTEPGSALTRVDSPCAADLRVPF